MSEKGEEIVLQTQNNQPLTLIEMAIEKGVDMSQMEKLFDLQERFEKKEASKAFKLAMSEFMKDKPKLIKSKKVDFGDKKAKFNYIPLPKIQEVLDPKAAEQGLSYRWEVQQKDAKVTVTCIVSHVLGHEEKTEMTGPQDESGNKLPIHQIGSSTSYLKRYTLTGAFGLSSDEDTDGNNPAKKTTVDPESEVFKQMVEAIKTGKTTIEGIEKNYILTSTAKEILIKSIDVEELSLLFDLVEEKIPSSEFDNIKRILDNKEEANYGRVLFTLNKLKND